MKSDSYRHIVSAFLLGLILLANTGSALLLGRTLWGIPNTLTNDRPQPLPEGLSVDHETFLFYEYPLRILMGREILQGRFPGWNPYQSLGLPLAAQLEIRAFSPIQLLEVLLPVRTWGWVYLAKMFAAGIFTYALLFRVGCERISSLLGATFYSLSASFIWMGGLVEYVDSALFCPLLFLAAEFALSGTRLKATIVSTVAVFGLIVSGQPQITLIAFLGAALYFLLRFAFSFRWSFGPFFSFGCGALLATGLSMAQLALFEEFYTRSFAGHDPAWTWVVPELNRIIYVVPFLFGQMNHKWSALVASNLEWHWGVGFVGVLPLFLLLLGVACAIVRPVLTRLELNGNLHRPLKERLCRRPASPLFPVRYIAFGLLALGLCKAFGIAGINLVGDKFPLNYIHFTRYSDPFLALLVALILGISITELPRLRKSDVVLSGVALAIMALAIAHIAQFYFRRSEPAFDAPFALRIILVSAIPSIACGVFGLAIAVLYVFNRLRIDNVRCALLLGLVAELSLYIRFGLDLSGEEYRIVVTLSLLVLGVFVAFGVQIFLYVGLVVLLIGNICIISLAKVAAPSVQDLMGEEMPSDLLYIKQRLAPGRGRILAHADVLRANLASGLGVADIGTHGPFQISTTNRFLTGRALPRRINTNYWFGVSGIVNDYNGITWSEYFQSREIFNLLGVRWLIDKKDGELRSSTHGGIFRIYEGQSIDVYEDASALPRAYALSSVQLIDPLDDEGSTVTLNIKIEHVLSTLGQLNLRSTAVVEVTGRDVSKFGELVTNLKTTFVPVSVQEYLPNDVLLVTGLANKSFVVLGDAWYPGWKAEIDGIEVPIYRVNTIERGVIVERGAHRIRFHYEPTSLTWGLIATGLSGAVFIALLMVALLPRMHAQASPS